MGWQREWEEERKEVGEVEREGGSGGEREERREERMGWEGLEQ